jgi:hypothetical protein
MVIIARRETRGGVVFLDGDGSVYTEVLSKRKSDLL